MSNRPPNLINFDSDSDIGSLSLIVRPLPVEEKPRPNRFKCSASENNIKDSNKGIKQKIVSKVKSWSSRDKYTVNESLEVETDLARSYNNLTLSSESADELATSNLRRARDSLENLLKDEQNMPKDDYRCRSCSSTPESRDRSCPESPKSSPMLSDNSKPSTSAASGPFWDPFDKQGRKNRKDCKRKKKPGQTLGQPKKEDNSMPVEGYSCLKKKPEEDKPMSDNDVIEGEFPYKYKYLPKNSKSVVFTNEVFVVYFNGDDVVCESKEPLKKDVDQQLRNKEMRHGHLLRTQEKYNLCLF